MHQKVNRKEKLQNQYKEMECPKISSSIDHMSSTRVKHHQEKDIKHKKCIPNKYPKFLVFKYSCGIEHDPSSAACAHWKFLS